MAKTNIQNDQRDLRRILIYVFEGLLGVVCFLLWTMNQEMKTEISTLKNNQVNRSEQIVKLEGVITRYGQDIAEVRSSLTTVSNTLQEMRISQSLLNQQLLEKTRR